MNAHGHVRLPRRAGLGLVEAVVSVLIVAVAVTAALRAAGGAALAQRKAADRAQGRFLAEGMMAEIVALDYEDPAAPVKAFGPEEGELTSSKATFDDVDDYSNWVESPPTDRSGNPMSSFSGWQREVVVAWVTPSNPGQMSAAETGAKRITVIVRRGGALVAERTAIRARS